jgi:two-component system cell cycle response regulator
MEALVLEPSKFWQRLLSDTLSGLKFSTDLFADGGECLDYSATKNYDIVLVSLHLADMTGIEFCRQFCERQPDHPPIILLTSNETDETVGEAIRAGATEVFFKSKVKNLTECLEGYARKSERRGKLVAKVLLAEDSVPVASFTRKCLAERGMEVDIHISGETAWEAYQAENYDLVMVDVVLAGTMTGLNLVRLIRQAPERHRARVPILAFSALTNQRRTVELLNAGASDYLPKPFIEEELVVRAGNLVMNYKLLDQVERQRRHLQRMALTDQLTGLYNRHCLMEFAPKTISEAIRHGYDISVAVLDLDHFKQINDTFGHQTGDAVLSEVASLLKRNTRKEDLVARFGGEEFVMLLSHCDKAQAQVKCEELRAKLGALRPNDLEVTASIGFTSMPASDKEVDFAKLFYSADQGVYSAKLAGRNAVHYHPFVDYG